jgi:protein-tyrosine phosphatase
MENESRAWSPAQRARLDEWNIERSVDVHCHCLPGLDDGPAELEDSLALCQALVEDGVTTVIASPHQLGRYDGVNTAAVIREALAELQAALDENAIPLELTSGADVRIDERLFRLVEAGEVLPAGPASRHLLLELPHDLFVDPLGAIEALAQRGVQTIMTHPERHRYLAGSTQRLGSWIDAGAALQITAGSLLGDFGPVAEQEGWRMLRAGMVSLIATDAHDESRPPLMTAALDVVSQQLGRQFAAAVCLENPLRVYRGQRVEACRPT